ARVPPEPVPVGSERLADLPLPVAVRGDAVSAQAAARALALGHAAALPAPLDEPWTRWLARRLDERAVTLTAGAAPSEARTVLDVGDGTVAVDGRVEPWQPSLVSAATAETLARAHASRGHVGLPREVRWAELSRPEPSPGRLLATLGRGDDGDVTLDLDADGPHLLVAGTTGAGKSALLETLVTGLAHDHAPTRLAIALIDLKGGAGLGACAALPHSRGLLTDLEPSAARRALLGLAHELRARKELLASAGSTSWTDLGSRGGDDEPPPRLLVVIDEFQELGGMDPGFLPELARLAAQGRSLGMHLVLATQRPAGVVTPDIRANVATVIALRTASAAESQDLLGDASAAALPADAPGRAIVATGTVRRTMQAALPLAQRRAPARKRGASGSPGPS
ncbi:FtsK/SpoIIIE domain-containing protein, partial [Demequina mangrovi]